MHLGSSILFIKSLTYIYNKMDICVNLMSAISYNLLDICSLHWNLHVDGCCGIQFMILLAIMIQRVDTSKALEAENGLIHTQETSWSRVVIYS